MRHYLLGYNERLIFHGMLVTSTFHIQHPHSPKRCKSPTKAWFLEGVQYEWGKVSKKKLLKQPHVQNLIDIHWGSCTKGWWFSVSLPASQKFDKNPINMEIIDQGSRDNSEQRECPWTSPKTTRIAATPRDHFSEELRLWSAHPDPEQGQPRLPGEVRGKDPRVSWRWNWWFTVGLLFGDELDTIFQHELVINWWFIINYHY